MTSSITCPAIIFAARRTAKLTGLTIYENSSRTNIKGAIHQGVPAGKKCAIKPKSPRFAMVINTQTKNIIKARANVIEIWLVSANVPGINPIMFNVRMNKNKEKTNGTYFFPLSPRVP